MELHEIRYVLAVCRTRNFTRAAELCNVSQPALTRAIQKIEGELGGLLFARERNNTHLTELGRLLQPHFEEVVARTETARDIASRFLRLECAELRLGVMCTIGPMRFVGFLSRFRADHPGIALTLVEGVPDRLSALLLAGELDAAVMAHPDGFEPPLRAEPLYRERFMLACPVGHPLAQRSAVTMRDLQGEPYLARINCEFRDRLQEIATEAGAPIRSAWRSEREDWIQTMVAAGMGVTSLPAYAATLPGLVLRPYADPEVVREVALVSVAARRWSSPVERFVQAIRRHRWPEVDEPIASAAGEAA